jgi:hypothetical protein
MSKLEDDGLVVDIDPRQLDLTLDPKTEKRAQKKDDDVQVEEKPEKVEPKPEQDDVISALRKQLENLEAENARHRAAYESTARERDEAQTHATSARGHAMQSQYDLVNTEIANDKARQETIKRELKIARETGNTDLESDLIVENARIGVKLQTNEQRKQEIEIQARREKERREAPKVVVDPFEAALQGVSAKSQAWLRAHPECVTDDVMNAKVLLADKEARRKGFAADTPEYFQYIEESMGYRRPQREEVDDDEVDTRRADKSERRPSYSAPPSRDSSSPSSLKPTQKRLSREQVEMAESMGMTPAQYAAWMAKAERDQKYVNN